jgi:membrane associated rhomboid family serine protease
MDKNKFTEKLKEGVSVQEIEQFARKHSTEVFTVLALIIGAISSAFQFFTGPGLTIIFMAIGAIIGIFFPIPVEKSLKQLYAFTHKQENTTQLVLGAVKIVIAIFIPFILFGVFGLLSGTSYHYYNRISQSPPSDKSGKKSQRGTSGEEHD